MGSNCILKYVSVKSNCYQRKYLNVSKVKKILIYMFLQENIH
jgi:hypothetical protein